MQNLNIKTIFVKSFAIFVLSFYVFRVHTVGIENLNNVLLSVGTHELQYAFIISSQLRRILGTFHKSISSGKIFSYTCITNILASRRV